MTPDTVRLAEVIAKHLQSMIDELKEKFLPYDTELDISDQSDSSYLDDKLLKGGNYDTVLLDELLSDEMG